MKKTDYERIIEMFGLEALGAVQPEFAGEADPSEHAASLELGEGSMRRGDFAGAARYFSHALNAGQMDEAKARLGLAGAYECLEQSPAALRQYQRATRLLQDDPEPYLGLADIYRRHGRAREGIARLRAAIALDTENAFLHGKLAEALRSVGMYEMALRAAQHAVLFAPDQAFYHYWMGDLLVAMRRHSEALEALHAALQLSPGDSLIVARAAIAFWGAGRPADAIKAARMAGELNPDNGVYDGLLRRFLLESGDIDEANTLVRGDPENMDPYDLEGLQRMLAEVDLS